MPRNGEVKRIRKKIAMVERVILKLRGSFVYGEQLAVYLGDMLSPCVSPEPVASILQY